MFAGHIALDREDAAGFRAFVKRGQKLLEHGASLAIFPEGTRSMDGKLGQFKRGAFTIARKAHV
jgi:1-acyl-sn-glycerol-3-phosphate acyltransferase